MANEITFMGKPIVWTDSLAGGETGVTYRLPTEEDARKVLEFIREQRAALELVDDRPLGPDSPVYRKGAD